MKKILYIITVLILLALTFTAGFLIARKTYKLDIAAINTFYASIEEINGKNLLVNGLDVNDINGRQRFTFTVHESTSLIWRGTEIALSDLKVNQKISITYTGEVLEMSPVIIKDILKIQLLEDEK